MEEHGGGGVHDASSKSRQEASLCRVRSLQLHRDGFIGHEGQADLERTLVELDFDEPLLQLKT